MTYSNYSLMDYIPEISIYAGEDYTITVSVGNELLIPTGGIKNCDCNLIMCKYGSNVTTDIVDAIELHADYTPATSILNIHMPSDSTTGKNGKYKFQIKYKVPTTTTGTPPTVKYSLYVAAQGIINFIPSNN